SSVSKYSLELSEGRGIFKEEISIDIAKGTETFHVPKTSLNESAGNTVYDFKKQMTMIHLAAEKACYVWPDQSIKLPQPLTVEDLPTTSTEKQMKVVGLLDEGSVLSTEMEDLCANQPIYVVV
ncbi:unnamed protein product, partial [Pocillopora meandrina]